MLLQLCAAGLVFVPAVPGERPGVQGPAEEKGEPAHLPGRPFPQHRHPEEEGRGHTPQEVHLTPPQGER